MIVTKLASYHMALVYKTDSISEKKFITHSTFSLRQCYLKHIVIDHKISTNVGVILKYIAQLGELAQYNGQ
jgi:hypothetical protein